MELRQLRYFIGVVDAGSFSRAAERLHIAQPALGQQIFNLESELGVQLLVRSVRGIAPTDAGVTFYRHAQLVLRDCAQAAAATRGVGAEIAGIVSIGLPTSVFMRVGLALLSETNKLHPGIRLQLTDSPSAYLTELLLQGRLDLAILLTDEPVKGLKCKPMLEESLLFVGSGDAINAELAVGDVCLREVAAHPLALPTLPNKLRQQVDSAFRSIGLEPRIAVEVNSMAMLAQIAATGLAHTVMSWSSVARELDNGTVTARRIVEPEISRTLSICHSDMSALTGAVMAMYVLLEGLVMRLADEGSWRGAIAVAAQ